MAQAKARNNCNPHLTDMRDGSCPVLCPTGRQEGGQAAPCPAEPAPRGDGGASPSSGQSEESRASPMAASMGLHHLPTSQSLPTPATAWMLPGCRRCLLQAVRAVIIDPLTALTHCVCPSYKPGSSLPGSLQQAAERRRLGRYTAGMAWISPKLPSSWAHHLRKYMQNQLKT